MSHLSEARLFSRNVAPLLDHRFLDLPGVGPGPGAHLLGYIHTLLGGLQIGHQLGDVLTGSLGLQRTLFLGSVLYNSLDLVITFLSSFLEATSSRSTQLPGLLGTASDGSVLLHILLGYRAHLLGPLGALGVGGVTGGLVLTLLLNLSGTFDDIVLDIMNLLLGPTLGLVLSPVDLRTLDITVLDQRSSADISCLVEGDLFVLDETAFPEVLLALLLLLGLVVGHVGGVTPPVVGVVALHYIVVLCLLHHLHLVNTPLTVSTRSSSCYSTKVYWSIISLTVSTACEGISFMCCMVTMTPMVMVLAMSMMFSFLSIERESSQKVPALPGLIAPQLTGAHGRADHKAQGQGNLCTSDHSAL